MRYGMMQDYTSTPHGVAGILAEVVYLLLVQHEDVMRATDVPWGIGQ